MKKLSKDRLVLLKEILDLLKILAAVVFWLLVVYLSFYFEIFTPPGWSNVGKFFAFIGFYATLWLIFEGHKKLKTYFYSVHVSEWHEHGRSKWQKFYCWLLFID